MAADTVRRGQHQRAGDESTAAPAAASDLTDRLELTCWNLAAAGDLGAVGADLFVELPGIAETSTGDRKEERGTRSLLVLMLRHDYKHRAAATPNDGALLRIVRSIRARSCAVQSCGARVNLD